MIEFENIEKFYNAMGSLLNGEEAYRSYTDLQNQVQRKKIISKNRLYVGNELSLNAYVNPETKKVYLSIDYFGVEDRINVKQHRENNSKVEQTNV